MKVEGIDGVDDRDEVAEDDEDDDVESGVVVAVGAGAMEKEGVKAGAFAEKVKGFALALKVNGFLAGAVVGTALVLDVEVAGTEVEVDKDAGSDTGPAAFVFGAEVEEEMDDVALGVEEEVEEVLVDEPVLEGVVDEVVVELPNGHVFEVVEVDWVDGSLSGGTDDDG